MDDTFTWEKEAWEVLEYLWELICISLRWDTWQSSDLQVLSLGETPVDSLEIQQNTFLERKECLLIFGGQLEAEVSTKPIGMFLHTELLSLLHITLHVVWWYIWITYHATKGLGAMILCWVFHNTCQKDKRCYGFSLYFLSRKPMQVLLCTYIYIHTQSQIYYVICACIYIYKK